MNEAEPFLIGDQIQKSMPYTQEATTWTHYKRLMKYIRLVDFLVIDAKLSLIQNSINTSLNDLQRILTVDTNLTFHDRMRKQPLFEIEIIFVEWQLVFIPSKSELWEAVNKNLTEGIHLVCQNKDFMSSPEFAEYTEGREGLDDETFDE